MTSNQTGAKVTASIPAAMPPGPTLSASLATASGATSASFQAIGTIAIDMVSGIGKLAQSAMVVTYRLDATPAAGIISSASRVVTYAITAALYRRVVG